METWVSVISAVAAVAATAIGVLVYQGQSRQAAFELARSLHAGLTTGDVVLARDVLGTYRRSPAEGVGAELSEVLKAYFVLLWCFERILAGRRAMSRRRRANADSPAIVFLDQMVRWHLQEWATGLPEVRARLRHDVAEHRGTSLDDAHSWSSFEALLQEMLTWPLPVPGLDGTH